jgi:hypothetical protein
MATNLGCLHVKWAYNHCRTWGCRNNAIKCPLHQEQGDSTATCNLTRAAVLSGLSDEARETIDNAIALSPALEGTILLIAELCFRDGEDYADGPI